MCLLPGGSINLDVKESRGSSVWEYFREVKPKVSWNDDPGIQLSRARRRLSYQSPQQTFQDLFPLLINHQPVPTKRQPGNTAPTNRLILDALSRLDLWFPHPVISIKHELFKTTQHNPWVQCDVLHAEHSMDWIAEGAFSSRFRRGKPEW